MIDERAVCPDCGSSDVHYTEGFWRPMYPPPWNCHGCGIRFEEPDYADVEVDA